MKNCINYQNTIPSMPGRKRYRFYILYRSAIKLWPFFYDSRDPLISGFLISGFLISGLLISGFLISRF